MKTAILITVVAWMCIEGYYFISSLWEHRRLRELLDRDEISFEEYWMKIEEYALNQKLPHFFDNGIPKKTINIEIESIDIGLIKFVFYLGLIASILGIAAKLILVFDDLPWHSRYFVEGPLIYIICFITLILGLIYLGIRRKKGGSL